MESYITHALLFFVGILAGMSLQWRRNKAEIERLEGETLYLSHALIEIDDEPRPGVIRCFITDEELDAILDLVDDDPLDMEPARLTTAPE